ncbi:MAG: flagellar hook-length control protein FliK, partial [Spirochaetia bacterium]
ETEKPQENDREKVNTQKIQELEAEIKKNDDTNDDTEAREEEKENIKVQGIKEPEKSRGEEEAAKLSLQEMQFLSAEAVERGEKSEKAASERQRSRVKTATLQKGTDEGSSKETKTGSDGSKNTNSLTIVDLRTDKESKTDKRLAALRGGSAKTGEEGSVKNAGDGQASGSAKGDRTAGLELKEELLKNNNISKGSKGWNSSAGENTDAPEEKVQVLRADLSSQAKGKSGGQSVQSGKFDSSLLRQLKEQLNGQIVKKSGIVLRNNGNGEIRLNIKPEHLGSVRIRVSLEDNHIAGKIYVENSNMKEVFEQNMNNLQRQFEENGYESASLEVSVGDGKNHREKNQNSGFTGGENSRAIKSLEEHVPDTVNSWNGEQLVDLMV